MYALSASPTSPSVSSASDVGRDLFDDLRNHFVVDSSAASASRESACACVESSAGGLPGRLRASGGSADAANELDVRFRAFSGSLRCLEIECVIGCTFFGLAGSSKLSAAGAIAPSNVPFAFALMASFGITVAPSVCSPCRGESEDADALSRVIFAFALALSGRASASGGVCSPS